MVSLTCPRPTLARSRKAWLTSTPRLDHQPADRVKTTAPANFTTTTTMSMPESYKRCYNKLRVGDFLYLGLRADGSLSWCEGRTIDEVSSQTPPVKVIGISARQSNMVEGYRKYLLVGSNVHVPGFWTENSGSLPQSEVFLEKADDFDQYAYCRWIYGQNRIVKIDKRRAV